MMVYLPQNAWLRVVQCFTVVKIFTKSVKELVLMHCVCRLQVFHETDPGPC